MNKFSLYFFLSLVVIAGVGLLGLYFVRIKETNSMALQRSEFLKVNVEADRSHDTGDYDGAIQGFKKLEGQSSDKAADSKVRAKLASNLFRRNGEGDREESMRIYKSIINDFTTPAFARAIVLDDLAQTLAQESELFIRKNLDQEPFISYLPKSGEPFDSQVFSEKVFKYSDEIYPNSLAKLSLANMYTVRVGNGLVTGTQNIKDVELLIQKEIEDADKLINSISYEPIQLLRQYLYRAIGLQSNGRFLGTPPFEEREEAYKKALAESLKYSDVYSMSIRAQIRVFYAAFLARFSQKDRTSDIKEILRPFAGEEGKVATTKAVFTALNERAKGNFFKESCLILAKISPEFKAFLNENSWGL